MRGSVLLLLASFGSLVCASPKISHWRTGNGSEVFFVGAPELPIVDIKLVFDAGSARDPKDKRGLAALVNSLLDEGAGGMSATAISFEFERLGAIYSAEAGADSASVELRSLSDKRQLQPALENLRRVIAMPDFPEKSIDRQKKRIQLGIQRKQQSPAALARDAYMAAVYQDHPYAFPRQGTVESIASISRADVEGFYRQLYTAGNVMVVIVGDVTRTAAAALAEELTQALAKGQKPPPLPKVMMLEKGNEISIDHPSSQVHILFGQPGIRRGDADYFPLYVGNHVLGGGGMVSRLFEEVREKRGLSYSSYSYFSPQREDGPFIAGLQTRADQQDQALSVMQETIQSFVDEGPTPDELVAAKRNISGGFPLRLDSNSKILGYVAMIGFYDLPLDYLDTFVEKVDAVTIAEIKDAFQRRLEPDKFVTVMVGPARSDSKE